MPEHLIDLLRLGFPGLAAYLLYLGYKLSRQIVAIPDTPTTVSAAIAEKRKAVQFYGVLCFAALLLSIGADVANFRFKPAPPPPAWIAASAIGQFTEAELKQRPLELTTWLAGGAENDFKSFTLSRQARHIEIPSNGGMVMISVPNTSEAPR